MKLVTKFDHPEHNWIWTKMELEWINAKLKEVAAAERKRCEQICAAEVENWRYSKYPYALAAAEHCMINIRYLGDE